jgi:hypothetical protein
LIPIEVYFFTAVLIFVLISLVRGFLKELGVTTVMVVALFLLSQFGNILESTIQRAMGVGAVQRVVPEQVRGDPITAAAFILFVIFAAFISYHGETLAFGGKAPKGSEGILFTLLIGAVNGYLIAGSIWHYLHKYSYPFGFMGLKTEDLSGLAQGIVPYLPISLLGQELLAGVVPGQTPLLYIMVILILLRVVR